MTIEWWKKLTWRLSKFLLLSMTYVFLAVLLPVHMLWMITAAILNIVSVAMCEIDDTIRLPLESRWKELRRGIAELDERYL